MSYNKTVLMGNLTRDVEVKPVGDTKVAKFGLAVNEKFKDKEETMFIDCACWGNRADVLEKYFKKGSQILVEGKLKLETWEKDGEKKSKHTIFVTDFSFVDRVNKDGAESAPKTSAPQKKNSSPKPASKQNDDEVPPF